jgi:hypothetical protein
MRGLGLELTIVEAWVPPAPRGSDDNLMDYFLNQGYSIPLLLSINRCRVYLQDLSLSKLVSKWSNVARIARKALSR